jgi:toxin ParE1/3/4
MPTEITNMATKDLAGIWATVGRDSVSAADQVMERFFRLFDERTGLPSLGRARDDIGVPGMRSFAEGNFVVFYVPEGESLRIYRVIHAGRQVTPDMFRSEMN